MELGLRHVQVVLAVAEAGSINRAAVRLKIAQAGLTAQLHRIEDGLGGQLFVRRSDGVTLTDLGVHVVRRGRELSGQFDDLLSTAKVIGRQQRSTAAIQTGGTDPLFVPLMASAVARLLPNREQMTHQEIAAETALDLVRSRRLDMAAVAVCPYVPTAPTDGLLVRTLAIGACRIALPAGHRLAGRDDVQLAELAGDAWVVPDDRVDGLRLSLRIAAEQAGFTPRFRHFGADAGTTGQLVAGGHAVALIRAGDPARAGTVHRDLAGAPLTVRSLLAWTADSPLSELADDLLIAVLADRTAASGCTVGPLDRLRSPADTGR